MRASTVSGLGIAAGIARANARNDALAPFLQVQRWFGGKARGLKAVRVMDWAPLTDGGDLVFLVFLEVELGDGTTDWYFVPLGITAVADWPRTQSDYVHAQVPGRWVKQFVHDALADEAVRAALLDADRSRDGNLPTHAWPHPRLPDHRFRRAARPARTKPLPAQLQLPTSSNSLITLRPAA